MIPLVPSARKPDGEPTVRNLWHPFTAVRRLHGMFQMRQARTISTYGYLDPAHIRVPRWANELDKVLINETLKRSIHVELSLKERPVRGGIMETWRPEEIGATAGKVWNFLHKRGESSLSAIERGVGAPKQLVCMAIGWLAREGKVALRQEKRSLQLCLTDGEGAQNSRMQQ